MRKLQRAAALIIGLLIAVLVLGCDNSSTDKPKDPEPQKPKITLNYEPVKLEQGKELSLAKINNTDKIVITKTFHRTGAMTKIGDTIYIRNANTGTILEAKLEDDNLKITNAEFVKDVPEESFLSNDGKELIYTDAKRKVNAVASDGTSKPFYEQVLQYVKDNGLTDDIHFIGEVPDIESYMQRARTLIIPSRSEGFGLCMPEAMFNGCLCIGHDTGGTHEQLENGLRLEGAEIALRYDNTEELSRLLCEITDRKPEYYDTMTQRAFHAVNTLYSSEINGDNIYKFYQDIL